MSSKILYVISDPILPRVCSPTKKAVNAWKRLNPSSGGVL